MTTTLPELSIIVPVLNDAAELRGLLDCLAGQTGIIFEIILCDGGSTDTIRELMAEYLTRYRFVIRHIETARGRGIQMNTGAAAAAGDTLLFLHADSRFLQDDALMTGVKAYKTHQHSTSIPCAARFRLHFRRSETTPSLAYRYHETKARLNRSICIRGDQGYLIDRTIFIQLGCFDCSLPFLEDVRLAASLAKAGEWLLLPADISTSARRFEQEGFYERQVANVIIVNAIETGWNELLAALPELYRTNCSSGRLILFPLLNSVRAMILNHDREWQSNFWRATGTHVASNAWQIFLWLDVRRAFYARQSTATMKTVWFTRYERWFRYLFESRPAGRLAKKLTRIWFWWILKATGKTFAKRAGTL
jgi:rSAM/selenodomain-associated transferase 2